MINKMTTRFIDTPDTIIDTFKIEHTYFTSLLSLTLPAKNHLLLHKLIAGNVAIFDPFMSRAYQIEDRKILYIDTTKLYYWFN